MHLQIKAMAVEMEDRLIAYPTEILRSALFSNACLKRCRSANHHPDIYISPSLCHASKYFYFDKKKQAGT
ncbi:hypothetical protein Hdeb2414_s0009g00319721 [Helianthus debilis subsp. tardiflorus]